MNYRRHWRLISIGFIACSSIAITGLWGESWVGNCASSPCNAVRNLQWEVLITGIAALFSGYFAILAIKSQQADLELKEAIRFAGKAQRTVRGSIDGINNQIQRFQNSSVAPIDLSDLIRVVKRPLPVPNSNTPLPLQLAYDRLEISLLHAEYFHRSNFSTEKEAIEDAVNCLKEIHASLINLNTQASDWYETARESLS